VALEGGGLDVRLTRRTLPVLAITAAHLLRLLRVARGRLVVSAASASFGAVALALSLHNDPPVRPVARALAILSWPLTLSAAVLVAPVREAEGPVRSLARVTRTRWTTLLAAFALTLATPSSAFGATAGALAGVFAREPPTTLGITAGAWAVPIAFAVAIWARWLDRRPQRGPVVFCLGAFVVGAVATGVASTW
jgi:hypothetical protein